MRISETVRKMIMVMLVTALVMAVAGTVASVFYPIHSLHFAIGVLLTTGLNIIKVIWLEHAVEKAVAMDDQTAASNYIRMQYLLRLLLTGLILVFAAVMANRMFVPSLLWGAVIGIFTFHAAKYALVFIVKANDTDADIS